MRTSHKKATKASTASLHKDVCDFIAAGVACSAFSRLSNSFSVKFKIHPS